MALQGVASGGQPSISNQRQGAQQRPCLESVPRNVFRYGEANDLVRARDIWIAQWS